MCCNTMLYAGMTCFGIFARPEGELAMWRITHFFAISVQINLHPSAHCTLDISSSDNFHTTDHHKSQKTEGLQTRQDQRSQTIVVQFPNKSIQINCRFSTECLPDLCPALCSSALLSLYPIQVSRPTTHRHYRQGPRLQTDSSKPRHPRYFSRSFPAPVTTCPACCACSFPAFGVTPHNGQTQLAASARKHRFHLRL